MEKASPKQTFGTLYTFNGKKFRKNLIHEVECSASEIKEKKKRIKEYYSALESPIAKRRRKLSEDSVLMGLEQKSELVQVEEQQDDATMALEQQGELLQVEEQKD